MSWRDRLVPLIVACPLFLQNIDTSVMATALPTIATALNVAPLHLNLAITAYLLSIAVFLPLSGWCADRFGARKVFCWAIGLFAIGSALCGMANSLAELVVFRIIQGLGGALMVPVARLILLRSVTPAALVAAMVWFTVPPTVGRMVGPLVGGAIVSWVSWRWIFLINIPFGLLGIWLALQFIPRQAPEGPGKPFDVPGFVLLAIGLACVVAAIETAGKGLLPVWATAASAVFGTAMLILYARLGRDRPNRLIDLSILRLRTYRTSVIGGAPLRIAIGASPFLLPLMLQVGFGLSPLDSGLLTVATAIGSLATRTVIGRLIRRLGFRRLLIGATIATSLMYASYGLFRPETPHLAIFCTLLLGGLINSLSMVAMQSLGFADVPKPRMSDATTLSSMAQQLSVSLGVVFGAAMVTVIAWFYGDPIEHLQARDFPPAFLMIGLLTLVSLLSFVRLRPEDGEALRGLPGPQTPDAAKGSGGTSR